jgi:hypothetical protein
MARPRVSLIPLAVVLLSIVALEGCSQPPEKQLLDRYFQAARVRDNVTLGNIATVSFSPIEDGAVQGLKIESVSPEERRPLHLKQYAQEQVDARAADEEFTKRKQAYQKENMAAIERVLKAERANTPLRGKDLEVQAAWTKWREDTATHSKRVSDANRQAGAERTIAILSAMERGGVTVDPSLFDGEIVTKDVIATARVKKGDEPPAERRLHIRMTKVDLTNGPDGKSINGRWIITEVEDQDKHKTASVS